MIRLPLFFMALFVFSYATLAYADANAKSTAENYLDENTTKKVIDSSIRNDGLFFDGLPLFKQQMYEAGMKPPKPFFISPFFFIMGDKVLISDVHASIQFTPETAPQPMPDGTITLSNTDVRSNTYGFNAGIWILPFWNIYGMYAFTDAQTSFNVKVNSNNPVLIQAAKEVTPTTNVSVHTAAVGTTVAYGLRNIFFGFDAFGNINFNYSWSDVNILDNTLSMIILSPRVGLARKLPNKMNLSFWVGGMYKDDFNTNNTAQGKYMLGDLTAYYTAKKRFLSPWNMVAGFLFQPCNWFSFITEAGFINRWSVNMVFQFAF